MKASKMPRVLAAMFLGAMFGLYRHFRQMQWLGRGRDAFLADQSRAFDQIIQRHAAGVTLVAGVILAAVAVGLYEGLVFGIAKLIPAVDVEE